MSQRYGSVNPDLDPYQNVMDPQKLYRPVGSGILALVQAIVQYNSTISGRGRLNTKYLVSGGVLSAAGPGFLLHLCQL